MLFDHVANGRGEIDDAPFDREPPRQPRARQIVELVEHVDHALRAGHEAGGHVALLGIGHRLLEHLPDHGDDVEWASQIVADRGDEHFVKSQRLGELEPLPAQLDERIDLVAQDSRLDRLVKEVDRPRVVPIEHALVVVDAGCHEDDRNVT